MNIFEKLMLARQISFNEGKIVLLNQRLVMFTSDFLGAYTLKINDEPGFVRQLYDAGKESVREGFGPGIGKSYSFSFNDFFKWYVDIARLSGWGLVKWEGIDEARHEGTLTIEDSPIAMYLRGRVKGPCDHMIRGFMAGGASSAFKTEVEMVETECYASGAPRCRFVFGPRDAMGAKFRDLYEQQVGPAPAADKQQGIG